MKERVYNAMVLAAGFGTRLRPLTELVPKPLVPVGNRPLIIYPLHLLARAGVRRVVINLHHLAEKIPEELAQHKLPTLDIVYSRERKILGTGGGIVRVRKLLAADRFFLLNGDTLHNVNLRTLLRFHLERGASATMVVRPLRGKVDFTPLELDGEDRIVRLLDATTTPRGRTRKVMFCGIHILEPEVFDFLPRSGFSCINRTAYTAMIERGLKVCGFMYDGPWYDIGTPARYLAVNLDVAGGRLKLPPPGTLGRIHGQVLRGPRSRVAPDARVGPRVVLGAGCLVPGGCRISRSVIWEGAVLEPGQKVFGEVVTGKFRLRCNG